MTIRNLLGSLDPPWKPGNIVVVGQECKTKHIRLFHARQQAARLCNRESVRRRLRQNPYESQFRDRTSGQSQSGTGPQPVCYTTVEFVVNEPKRDERVYIEKVCHGKLARMSSTSLLLRTGAFGPALRTGRPVTESVTILTGCGRFFRGVSTMRPDSTFTSSGSPARMPSRRRSGPGRTTCPLVETLVCTVRQSYHISGPQRGCASTATSNLE